MSSVDPTLSFRGHRLTKIENPGAKVDRLTENPFPPPAAAMRYTFILNPAAGHGLAGRRRRAVEAALDAAALDVELRVTERPGHATELAREAARAGRVAVAVGGDGTVQEVSRGLIESGCPAHLGVVPLGTGNDFVKMVGMPRAPRAAVAALATAVPRRVDFGRVWWWDEAGSGEGTFVNAVGMGFDAKVAEAVDGHKALPGVASYFVAALQTLRHWQAPGVRVAVAGPPGTPDRHYEGDVLLVTAGNGTCSGGGFFLTPGASVTDGLFDVCLIEATTVPRILQLMPLALFGRHIHAREVHMHRSERLSVESDRPLALHADGEMLARAVHRVAVEIVPGGLSVLVPAGKAGPAGPEHA